MSGNQDWRTPADFWTVINKEFDFQFDAACSKQHNRINTYANHSSK